MVKHLHESSKSCAVQSFFVFFFKKKALLSAWCIHLLQCLLAHTVQKSVESSLPRRQLEVFSGRGRVRGTQKPPHQSRVDGYMWRNLSYETDCRQKNGAWLKGGHELCPSHMWTEDTPVLFSGLISKNLISPDVSFSPGWMSWAFSMLSETISGRFSSCQMWCTDPCLRQRFRFHTVVNC